LSTIFPMLRDTSCICQLLYTRRINISSCLGYHLVRPLNILLSASLLCQIILRPRKQNWRDNGKGGEPPTCNRKHRGTRVRRLRDEGVIVLHWRRAKGRGRERERERGGGSRWRARKRRARMTEGGTSPFGGRNDGAKVNEEKGTERKSAREEDGTRRACEKEHRRRSRATGYSVG